MTGETGPWGSVVPSATTIYSPGTFELTPTPYRQTKSEGISELSKVI